MENENKELELSERQLTILDAIIRNYLATGEPVGSRTISKYTDLNLSSATIRNEMSDLEEMGYIVQPHTSAGRIPSDKGYRLYVDHLIETNDKKEKELSDMKELVIENTEKMEQVLKQAAKVLANNTNYATLVSAPDVNHNKVKFIQLSQVDDQHMLAVIVMNNNMVRNKMLDLYEPLDNETAENKAEEIEIEGADEENTQAAEETKDTDVNEAKSEDDASADADEKKGLFKKKKKDKKDEQIEELNDRLKRQMAEFENFRKRSEKEKSQMFDMGAKTIVEKILPVIDNFERGLAAVPDDKKDDPFITGMDKVYKQMLTELDAAGVKPIECVGQEFDPDFHNAVMQVENDELESGTVAQELQKGYMYKDSVVRHSMVSVVQ